MSTNDPSATGRNDPYSTVRSKTGTTSRKGEGTKEGQLLASIVAEGHKITNTWDVEVESRRKDKLSSVYCSVMKI